MVFKMQFQMVFLLGFLSGIKMLKIVWEEKGSGDQGKRKVILKRIAVSSSLSFVKLGFLLFYQSPMQQP